MLFPGNFSRPGRGHVEGAEVRLPLDADVCRQEDLGKFEGAGSALQAPHGRVTKFT